jgi:hypothetical protein
MPYTAFHSSGGHAANGQQQQEMHSRKTNDGHFIIVI